MSVLVQSVDSWSANRVASLGILNAQTVLGVVQLEETVALGMVGCIALRLQHAI